MNFFRNIFKKDKQISLTDEIFVEPDIPEPLNIEEPVVEDKFRKQAEEIIKKNELIQLVAEENLYLSTLNSESGSDYISADKNQLLADAARLIVSTQVANSSILQDQFRIGKNLAMHLMYILQIENIVKFDAATEIDLNIKFKADKEVLFKTLPELENYINRGFLTYTSNWTTEIEMKQFFEENRNEIESRKEELLLQIREKQLIKEENLKNEREQIKQDLLEKERKRKLQREVLRGLIDEGVIYNSLQSQEGKRQPIPQDVMDKVWNRDGGKCTFCGSQENIEFDHIIPFSKGGSNTYRNLQILCKKCNLKKSDRIG